MGHCLSGSLSYGYRVSYIFSQLRIIDWIVFYGKKRIYPYPEESCNSLLSYHSSHLPAIRFRNVITEIGYHWNILHCLAKNSRICFNIRPCQWWTITTRKFTRSAAWNMFTLTARFKRASVFPSIRRRTLFLLTGMLGWLIFLGAIDSVVSLAFRAICYRPITRYYLRKPMKHCKHCDEKSSTLSWQIVNNIYRTISQIYDEMRRYSFSYRMHSVQSSILRFPIKAYKSALYSH